MKVLSIVGARPQFVKLAAISRAMSQVVNHGESIEHFILHTGQHYDAGMSDVFFKDLEIPAPNVNLEIGSGSHAMQTGRMLEGIETTLLDVQPTWTLVYGDTNSTLAGALASVKLGMPVAHLEAGLRSFNRQMPEEINRVLTDHAADLLLAPTETAASHLAKEGLSSSTTVTGDVMADICLLVANSVRNDPEPPRSPLPVPPGSKYLVATIHRAENTDNSSRLRSIIKGLHSLDNQVILYVHPRLRKRASEFGIELSSNNVFVAEPAPYPELIASVLGSIGVVTDSGGLQKEAFLLDRPCTTVRGETEWLETLVDGWNVLVRDLNELAAVASRPSPTSSRGEPYGAGDASLRAVRALFAASGRDCRTER